MAFSKLKLVPLKVICSGFPYSISNVFEFRIQYEYSTVENFCIARKSDFRHTGFLLMESTIRMCKSICWKVHFQICLCIIIIYALIALWRSFLVMHTNNNVKFNLKSKIAFLLQQHRVVRLCALCVHVVMRAKYFRNRVDRRVNSSHRCIVIF